MKRSIAALLVALSAVVGFGFSQVQSDNAAQEVVMPSVSSTLKAETDSAVTNSEATADALLQALMDPDGEYAAYAMYTAVLDKFGQVEPYVSIREAESRHIDALVRQLERLGVEVPSNPYLGKVEAPADLTTAAQAWAEGEIDNVALYDTLLASTTDANATKVFTNLRRASLEMHLPMFELAAENGGVLTQEQMQGM